jgi:hypothetical protein
MIRSRRIKHRLNVPVQRQHNANPGKHRWPATFRNNKQRFHRGLPFRRVVFCLG